MQNLVGFGMFGLVMTGLVGCTGSVDMIGHRGASFLAPENTLTSLRLGWQKDADVEIDVHLSQDKRIMVIHDADTKRITGVDLKVSETPSEALRRLDMGSFKDPAFAGERMPFLAEVVGAIPPHRKLYVEIKCGPEILPYLKKVIEQSGKMSRIVIIGFDLDTVIQAKQRLGLPTYWLRGTAKREDTEAWIPHDPNLVQTARDRGLDGLDVHYAGVTEALVRAAHEAGQKFYTWTVDDPNEARRLVELGVDGITTNRPAWLRRHLQR